MSKSELSWMLIKNWLLENPNKTAAIVTPKATYLVRILDIEPVPYLTKESIVEYVDR